MIEPNVFIGSPLYYNKIEIFIPTVKEVVSTPKFSQYLKILTLTQEEIEDDFVENKRDLRDIPTPFTLLMANAYNNMIIKQLTIEAFDFFFHKKPIFLFDSKTIILGDAKEIIQTTKNLDDLIRITEDDFFDLQNEVRKSVGQKIVERPNLNEHPKIKRMKALARQRDRIKAKQGGISFSTSLIAICCMGLGITPLNIGEMSYASVGAIIEMYQEKEKYKLDIDSLLAGADSKKIKPKYWIRNLD